MVMVLTYFGLKGQAVLKGLQGYGPVAQAGVVVGLVGTACPEEQGQTSKACAANHLSFLGPEAQTIMRPAASHWVAACGAML
jgi:hypothetical protein